MRASSTPRWVSRCAVASDRSRWFKKKRKMLPTTRTNRSPPVPEGDTIFRAARTLDRALAGKTVTRFESAFPRLTRVHEDTPLTGRTIERVDARGKWLMIHFSGDLILLSHLLM